MTASRSKVLHHKCTSNRLIVLAVGLTSVILPMQAITQPRSLTFPVNGVICDQAAQIFYDKKGVSLPLTRRYFDARAEQNLQLLLDKRRMPDQFQLSSGELCDVQRGVCWTDGTKKKVVSNQRGKQLYGIPKKPEGQWGTVATRMKGREFAICHKEAVASTGGAAR